MPVVGRLAPSPTGQLHIGNARSLALAWLSARSRGGRIWLRVEDLTPDTASHTADLLADLAWLGLDWDAWDGARSGWMRQSERAAVHADLLERLVGAGRAYPCVCTRKDIEAAGRAPHVEDRGAAYPGTCRDRFASAADAARFEAERAHSEGRAPLGVALRLRVPEAPVVFTDDLRGPVAVHLPTDSGDFVVRRKDGGSAYMFAVVADDIAMGVTEVVRGDDLLEVTAQQVAVYAALAGVSEAAAAARLPRHLHVPLVLGSDGRRLAKRNRSLHLGALREAGVTAAAVRAWLARSVGLPDGGDWRGLAAQFRWDAVPREAIVFGGSLDSA